ncbi:hypothetical protein D3C86_1051360 [compost metagenome]
MLALASSSKLQDALYPFSKLDFEANDNPIFNLPKSASKVLSLPELSSSTRERSISKPKTGKY